MHVSNPSKDVTFVIYVSPSRPVYSFVYLFIHLCLQYEEQQYEELMGVMIIHSASLHYSVSPTVSCTLTRVDPFFSPMMTSSKETAYSTLRILLFFTIFSLWRSSDSLRLLTAYFGNRYPVLSIHEPTIMHEILQLPSRKVVRVAFAPRILRWWHNGLVICWKVEKNKE